MKEEQPENQSDDDQCADKTGNEPNSADGRRDLLRMFGAGFVLSVTDLNELVAAIIPKAPLGAMSAGSQCSGIYVVPHCPPPQIFYYGDNCGEFDCTNFKCTGEMFDDFECTSHFTCTGETGAFNCVGSFDDEDCEDYFFCPSRPFNCTSAYN